MLTLYEITYTLTNIFGTYIIYKILTIFFTDSRTSKKAEVLSYFGYYIISSALFYTVRIPIVMIFANIVLFFCLSLNYHSNLKKRLVFALLAYLILMCTEVMVSVGAKSFNLTMFSGSEFDSVIGMFLIRIISVLVVSIMKVFKNLKNDMPVPNSYWFGTVFISVASLALLITLFENGNFTQTTSIIVAFAILSINIMVVIMYDNLYKAFEIKSEKKILLSQNRAYEQQFALMEQSLNSLHILQHDMKNHMVTVKNLSFNSDQKELTEYMDTIIGNIENYNIYSNSGNCVIDSILNFKLHRATTIGVKPVVEIAIPQKIELSSYGITAILGNLMDNALTALESCHCEKTLSVQIKYSKSNIIITIVNSYDGVVNEKNGGIETTKKDMINHGYGLDSVRSIVEKNQGQLDIDHDNNFFKVTVLLPC